MFIQPLHLVITALAIWINKEQAEIIEYLREENRVLRERFHGRRLRFIDAERRCLAVKAKALGRKKRRRELGPIVILIPCCGGIDNLLAGSTTGAERGTRADRP